MITYKDRAWCSFDACIKHYPSKCDKVLTDHDLVVLRTGEWLVCTYAEKPDCFEQMNCILED